MSVKSIRILFGCLLYGTYYQPQQRSFESVWNERAETVSVSIQ